MTHHGDPLEDLIAQLPEDDLERTARIIASAHTAAAGKQERRGNSQAARFHRLLAGDVYKRLREAVT